MTDKHIEDDLPALVAQMRAEIERLARRVNELEQRMAEAPLAASVAPSDGERTSYRS